MKITEIECFILLDPKMNIGATSSAQDDIIVIIHTDEGIIGIGETDVNPWMAKACIMAPGTHTMGQGIREMLIGEDPLQIDYLWQKMYEGSAQNGRRGIMINAIGAIDIALHDIKGKKLGKPCHELLGSLKKDFITPYASLQPECGSFEEYKKSLAAWAKRAKEMGYRAAKAECTLDGPYAHMGLREPHHRMTEVIEAVREAVGDDFTLMIDTQYAFKDAQTCLETIRDWQDFDIYFLEAPIPMDDLDGYRRLSQEQNIPIAAGEWLATRFEFEELITRGNVAVVQPDVARVGGLTEACRVADMARQNNLKLVPHLWKTGVSIAAAIHFSAVTEVCPFIEFLPSALCESTLRKELLVEDIIMKDGKLDLPTKPGIGIELDMEAVRRFEKTASEAVAKINL